MGVDPTGPGENGDRKIPGDEEEGNLADQKERVLRFDTKRGTRRMQRDRKFVKNVKTASKKRFSAASTGP